jgi:hypothetical protein
MNVEALRALEKAVEAGDSFGIIPKGQKALGNGDGVCAAFDGSTDAALSLLASVLPGWRARIDIGRKFRAWVISEQNVKIDAYGPNPARAILLAIIRALIAQAEAKEAE